MITYSGAQLMGLPHIGSAYVPGWSRKRRRYERQSEVCEVCGEARAESTHHIVAVGMGGRQSARAIETDDSFCAKIDNDAVQFPGFVRSKMGSFEVYTPLIAVCGDGTRGCHGKFEHGTLSVEWHWLDSLCAELWESGWILSHGYEPNSSALYEFGFYRILDHGEVIREVRS
ncbi:MAG: hypothetical protein RSB04_10700 [Gordonibacter sp.]|uniref:hypothetical protein n=1 Tax=Gordonibacter sp. TaxID=1968902 RepID=UPI002FC92522